MFKFILEPEDTTKYYYRVEVSGGTVEDNLDKVFDLFMSFLEGCGYNVDRGRVGYGDLSNPDYGN